MTATENDQQTPTGKALAKIKAPGEAVIEAYKGSFAMVLPDHVKPDMFVRLSQGLLRRDKKLAQAANNNPGSFLSALLDCARLGLEPGDTYHLAVFGGEVTGITDWTGEVELIYRAGAVASIKAEIVYANDPFHWVPGTMDRPLHEPDWFGDRGDMIGVYAYGVMKDGSTSRVVIMSKAEVEKVRNVSRDWRRSSSPWQQWPDRMWLKTAVKQLAKWVPSSAEYREQAIRQEAAAVEAAGQMGVTLPAPDYSAPDMPDANPVDGDDDVVDAEIVEENGNGQQATEGRPAARPATQKQLTAVNTLLGTKCGATDDARFDALRDLGYDVETTKDLTVDEAGELIERLGEMPDHTPPTVDGPGTEPM